MLAVVGSTNSIARRIADPGWGIRRADEPVAVGLVQTPLLDAD
jgi:hypothetical protein